MMRERESIIHNTFVVIFAGIALKLFNFQSMFILVTRKTDDRKHIGGHPSAIHRNNTRTLGCPPGGPSCSKAD